MASRHALLIGISTYGEGLQPIPSARLDVEALQQVLLDPQLGEIPPEQLQLLTDPDRTSMEIAIESFYANKAPDDVLLFYFSGHGFRDEERQLLLSTRQSKQVVVDGITSVQIATTLPASIVRRHMERSRSTRQVVILDCCFSGAFAEGMSHKDGGILPLEAMLGGKGRAVLTSSDRIETSRAPQSGDGLSLYTRFLLEGIQTGEADRRRRGWCDPQDLHHYVSERLLTLIPSAGMTPQFFPIKEGGSIRVCRVRRDPSNIYRQKVQELAEKSRGVISVVYRIILEDYRSELGLQPELAAQIEADVLQPYVVNQQNLLRYRDALQQLLQRDGQSGGRLSHQDRE
ncbi:MAG: caspase domain-containing protein, partial [Cyanobacteriota bacterium]